MKSTRTYDDQKVEAIHCVGGDKNENYRRTDFIC